MRSVVTVAIVAEEKVEYSWLLIAAISVYYADLHGVILVIIEFKLLKIQNVQKA